MSLHVSARISMDKQSTRSLCRSCIVASPKGVTFSNPVRILGNMHIVPELLRLALRQRAKTTEAKHDRRTESTAEAHPHVMARLYLGHLLCRLLLLLERSHFICGMPCFLRPRVPSASTHVPLKSSAIQRSSTTECCEREATLSRSA